MSYRQNKTTLDFVCSFCSICERKHRNFPAIIFLPWNRSHLHDAHGQEHAAGESYVAPELRVGLAPVLVLDLPIPEPQERWMQIFAVPGLPAKIRRGNEK